MLEMLLQKQSFSLLSQYTKPSWEPTSEIFGKGQTLSKKYLSDDWTDHQLYHHLSQTPATNQINKPYNLVGETH